MPDRTLTVEKILSLLADMPARMAALTGGLPPEPLRTPPEPGAWSARDVLAHLRSCSDMWGRYIGIILREDQPTFKAMNPRTWMRQTDYLEQDFAPQLEAYTAQRGELLALLRPLAPEDWSRTATVTGAGKPIIRSVYGYAEWLAVHERSHIRQFEGIVRALRA